MPFDHPHQPDRPGRPLPLAVTLSATLIVSLALWSLIGWATAVLLTRGVRFLLELALGVAIVEAHVSGAA